MPKKAKPAKDRPLYRRKPPKAASPQSTVRSPRSDTRSPAVDSGQATVDFSHPHYLAPSHFTLREDGSIVAAGILPAVEPGFQPGGKNADISKRHENFPGDHRKPASGPGGKMPPSPSGRMPDATSPRLVFRPYAWNPSVRLYHGNCLELLDAIAAKYPEGRFDAIFADPPYFLSNGGITCNAGESHFRRPQLDLTA